MAIVNGNTTSYSTDAKNDLNLPFSIVATVTQLSDVPSRAHVPDGRGLGVSS